MDLIVFLWYLIDNISGIMIKIVTGGNPNNLSENLSGHTNSTNVKDKRRREEWCGKDIPLVCQIRKCRKIGNQMANLHEFYYNL